jgi:hypothetical protein
MTTASMLRTRWAAIGAAVALSLGAGGIGFVGATVTSGERTVFVPITPCRLFDTRPEFRVGQRSAPLGANDTHSVTGVGAVGNCTIPADAVGLVLNVTAVDATAPTFLAVWPSGQARPEASSLNPAPGQPPTPNAVTTDLGAGNQFNVFNLQGTVHVFADVVGYYADHNHDDRYYTEAETDALVAAKASPAQVDAAIAAANTPTSPVHIGIHEMQPMNGDPWEINGNSIIIGTSASGCVTSPLDIPAGAHVDKVTLNYWTNGSAVVGSVLVVGTPQGAANVGTPPKFFLGSNISPPNNSSTQSTSKLDVVHDPSPGSGYHGTYAETVSATDEAGIMICKGGTGTFALGTTEVHFTVP